MAEAAHSGEISLSEAAKALHLDQSTVRRQIKTGRFAYAWRLDEAGRYRIDLGQTVPKPAQGNSELEQELAILRERLAGKEALIEELRRERDSRQ